MLAGEMASAAPSAASTGAGEYVSGKEGGYRTYSFGFSFVSAYIYNMLQGQKLELAQMLALIPMPPVLEPLLLSLWYPIIKTKCYIPTTSCVYHTFFIIKWHPFVMPTKYK